MYFDENNNFFDMLNDNEFEYEKYDTDVNTNINIETINFNRAYDMFSLEEGFNKGNMFKDIYSKYKNHVYKLKVNNSKDNLLYKIQMHCFALKDLNLYLDVFPDDKKMINKFNEINNSLEELKKKYVKEVGPLCVTDMNSNTKFTWINNPWPWDKGGK